ncbi:MAG: hypothetical protein O7F76_05135 [Planctomycetota bacterium]|nr:hypothetical protein [Planctomycetota bacterium]
MRYGNAQLRLVYWLSAGCVVFGHAERSYAEFDPNDFPPQAVLVRTEAEFRAAAARTQSESITILVAGTVVMNNDTVVFPSSASIVKLVGIGDAPTIDFNLQWQGWGSSQNEVDGLRFESRQAIVHNLSFRNYNHRGGAIRATGPANGDLELLSVSNCTFENIGTAQFDHALDPSTGLPYTEPTLESQVVFNHCIYATGLQEAHVAIKNCSFNGAILNNRQWSRCLKVSAPTVVALNNTFLECGQPFDIGGVGSDTCSTVLNNRILNPALVDDNGVPRRAAIAKLDPNDHAVYMFNTFAGSDSQDAEGEVFNPWTGTLNPQRHLIDHNDYGALTYTGFWADNGIDWATWTGLVHRFDTHSVPPAHPSGTDPGTPAVGYPASAILVSNKAELQAAALECRNRGLNILISGTITINEALVLGNSNSVARLIGIGQDPSIDIQIGWGGWDAPDAGAEQGIRFHVRQAVLHGLTIKNYDGLGSAIRVSRPSESDFQLLSISDCRFSDIGTTQYPADIDPDTGLPMEHLSSSTFAVFNASVGCFGLFDGHIGVTGCSFERCQLNNVSWSHCLYVSARSVDVLNNTFRDCGNPFGIGSKVWDASNNVFRNSVIDPAYVQNRDLELVAAWFAVLRAVDFDTYMFNSMTGMSRQPYFTAPPANDRNYVDFNDYSGLQYYDRFFAHAGVGSGDFDDWNQIWKFDIHSAAPQFVDWPGPHVVNVTAENGSVVLDPNATEFPTDYVVSLTARPDPGYEFSNWSGDAAGNSPTITLTMDGDKNIIAEFSSIPSACGSGAFLPAAFAAISIVKLVRRRRRRTTFRPQ